jgi:hypothetical protein
MRGTGMRHPWTILSILALLFALSSGCQLPGGSSSSGAASESSAGGDEAERTRQMEEKAAEIERRAEEIRNMEGSDQEKIDALNELDRERRELERMQEGGPEHM